MKPDFDPSKVKCIAFDLFGTVFKLDRPREEIQAYAEHLRKPEWSPLVLPDAWGQLELHEDSKEGLSRLGARYSRWTMSNAPWKTQMDLKCYGLFHDVMQLERYEVFKPNVEAYVAFCIQAKWMPHNVLMVTANESFGDLEGARAIGMQAQLIDRVNKYGGEKPRTIIELAELMGGDA